MLGERLCVQQLDDALSLRHADGVRRLHVEGLYNEWQVVPHALRADEREVAGEVGASEPEQRDEELDLPPRTALTASGCACELLLKKGVHSIDVNVLVSCGRLPRLENPHRGLKFTGLESKGDGDIVSICCLDEHGTLKVPHPECKLDISLPDGGFPVNTAAQHGLDRFRRVSRITILADFEPVNHQGTSRCWWFYESGHISTYHLDDTVAEALVHDGFFPSRRNVVWQDIHLGELDNLHSRSTLELRDGLGTGNMTPIVESEHHCLAPIVAKMSIYERSELGIDEMGPCLD